MIAFRLAPAQISLYTYFMVIRDILRHRKIRAAFSFIAVCFLFLATVGIPLNQHWCGGKVFSERLYANTASCPMMSEHGHPGVSIEAVPCCSNTHSLQAAEGLDNDGIALAAKPIVQVASFAMVEVALLSLPQHNALEASVTESPPWVQRDIVLESHSYLI